jgi:two-component system response regulator DevR
MQVAAAGRVGAQPGPPFEVVLVTSRSALDWVFAQMAGVDASSVSMTVMPVSVQVLEDPRAAESLAAAAVAVVDASVDPHEALAFCRETRRRWPQLPISALVCCPQAAAAANLRAFVAEGVASFLDFHLSPEDVFPVLRGVSRGSGVVHLRLNDESSTALFSDNDGTPTLSVDERQLLDHVACGMTDHEIGVEMCLSHHTVKHRIERLRRRLQVRNRVALAALAGRWQAMQR